MIKNNILKLSLFLFVLISVLKCSKSSTPAATNTISPNTSITTQRTLYKNGKIFISKDGENEAKFAQAMVVEGENIVYVGTNDSGTYYKGANNASTEVDLGGKLVLPGFHDVHMHPLEVGSQAPIFVVSKDDDIAALKTRITTALNDATYGANTAGTWLIGNGFGLNKILAEDGSNLPALGGKEPRVILDEISSTRPIIIVEATSHSAWCNTAALNAWRTTPPPAYNGTVSHPTGYGKSVASIDLLANPNGGAFVRQSDNKTPNGIILDNCVNTMLEIALPKNEENDYNGFAKTNGTIQTLNSYGITSVCDARVYYKKNHHLTYQKLETDGKLTLRVNLGLWAYPDDDENKLISDIKALYTFDLKKLVRINQIKIYADGVTHNTTGAFRAGDYKQAYFGLTNNSGTWPKNAPASHTGLNYIPKDKLQRLITALEPTGFDMHIHVVGFRAVTESLDAIQAAQQLGRGRHRLSHCENILPADMARFKPLQVTMDGQVAGEFTQPANWAWNEAQLNIYGNGSNTNMCALKDAYAAGANVTLSSDWDVSKPHPFKNVGGSTTNPGGGLHNAVNRAPQNLTVLQAVKAYTINSAKVMRQESIVGTLESGKKADFIVVSQDLFSIDPSTIKSTEVEQTYFNGKKVFSK